MTVAVGTTPRGCEVNTNLSVLYVSNTGTPGSISVVDYSLATPAAINTITVGNNPRESTFDPINNLLYVPNNVSGNVSVIDTTTNTITTTFTVGSAPLKPGIDPIQQKVFVPNFGDDNVSVFDTSSIPFVSITTITVGDQPSYTAMDIETDRAYISNFNDPSVSVIDTVNNVVTFTITDIGSSPYGLNLNPFSILLKNAYPLRLLYIPDRPTEVTVVDLKTNQVLENIQIPGAVNPRWVGVNPYGNKPS
nr:YncE family protein [Shouchella lonarensis]